MSNWNNLRVEASVMERLRAFRRKLERMAAEGRRHSGKYADTGRFSLGDAIKELLKRDDAHAERARRSHRNRACKPTEPEATIEDAGQETAGQ